MKTGHYLLLLSLCKCCHPEINCLTVFHCVICDITVVNENNKEFNKAIFIKKKIKKIKRLLHSVQDDAIQIKCTNANKICVLRIFIENRSRIQFISNSHILNTTAQFHCNHPYLSKTSSLSVLSHARCKADSSCPALPEQMAQAYCRGPILKQSPFGTDKP